MSAPVKLGTRHSWSRTITDADIAAFCEISGDKGRHHLERDAEGRLLAHGLLTATLPTKLGGDLHYMAREMVFQFLKPVYGGDTLTALAICDKAVEQSTRYKVSFRFEIANQRGELVLTGTTAGQILK